MGDRAKPAKRAKSAKHRHHDSGDEDSDLSDDLTIPTDIEELRAAILAMRRKNEERRRKIEEHRRKHEREMELIRQDIARERAERKEIERQIELERQKGNHLYFDIVTHGIPPFYVNTRFDQPRRTRKGEPLDAVPCELQQGHFEPLDSIRPRAVPFTSSSTWRCSRIELTTPIALRHLFLDVAETCNLDERVWPHFGLYGGTFRPDFGILCTEQNRMVGAIHVVQPNTTLSLERPCAGIHQLLNYLLLLRAQFGVHHPFGILTSFDSYYVCWLPETKAIAESRTLVQPNMLRALETSRVLCHSQEFTRTDHLPLIRMLSSVVVKALDSPLSPIKLINDLRMYPCVREPRKQLRWHRNVQIDELRYDCRSMVKKTRDTSNLVVVGDTADGSSRPRYVLLQEYPCGRDGNAWLAGEPVGPPFTYRLVVIKFPTSDNSNIIVEECERWNKCYGAGTAHTIHALGDTALVMPFAFNGPSLSGPDRSARNRLHESDRARFPQHAEVERLLHEKLRADAEYPLKCARIALERLAQKGFVHRDVQWRHVAVRPRMRRDGSLKLDPIMLDLTDLSKSVRTLTRRLHIVDKQVEWLKSKFARKVAEHDAWVAAREANVSGWVIMPAAKKKKKKRKREEDSDDDDDDDVEDDDEDDDDDDDDDNERDEEKPMEYMCEDEESFQFSSDDEKVMNVYVYPYRR